MNAFARAFAALCPLFLGACGSLLAYPDQEPEHDAALCGDGKDNDFDGRVDCDDSDCNGFCPEESAAACSDGLDNDGDGLKDAADARCWLGLPPKAERCAEASGAEILDNFDAPAWNAESCDNASCDIWSSWQRHGLFSNSAGISGQVVQSINHSLRVPTGRKDLVVAFLLNTTGSSDLGDNLGSLVHQRAFAGTFQGFELSFSASVPPGSMLRVGIVPVELAPIVDPPLPGAESALFALTIDAAHGAPTLSLDVEGAHASKALPFTQGLCGATVLCDEYLGRVSVSFDAEGFHAKLSYPNAFETELRAPAPAALHVPASRLVVWGGSTQYERTALFDDLRMTLKPEWPCGYAVPQIPGASCEYSDAGNAFGDGVAVARSASGQHCAIVTTRQSVEPVPDRLEVWRSLDGKSFTRASPPVATAFELPAAAALIGAGIAADEAGWHAAVAYRTSDAVELGFADGKECDQWGELGTATRLFFDAEPPSYVISAAGHEVYFTRPPTDQTRRTLWRVRRGSMATPELLAELPADVASPVSMQLVGKSDLVLAYPSVLGPSASGVGLLIGASDARAWRSVEPTPLLQLPSRLESNEGPVAFDDQGAIAAALAWGQDGGFILYAGTSTTAWSGAGTVARPVVAVGTARLTKADAPVEASARIPDTSCGDGSCGAGENCDNCGVDCPCGGVELLHDVFTRKSDWSIVTDVELASSRQYLSSDPPALNFAGGVPTWSVLPLARPVVGDFELSFDLYMAWSDVLGSAFCALHVGLGTVPDVTDDRPPAGDNPSGVFARMRSSDRCDVRYFASPLVVTKDSRFMVTEQELDRPGLCLADEYLAPETRQHVVLRREGSNVTVQVTRPGACGVVQRSLPYAGVVGPLPSLLIGFGGGPFEQCVYGGGSGTVTNLRLRLPDDPDRCPAGKTRCGAEPEQSSCVDTALSTEHCGGCGLPCAPNQVCSDGQCKCGGRPGIAECGGACVDTNTSKENCGGCGNVCSKRCVQRTCDLVVGDCTSPFALPAEGGTLPLDFSPVASELGQLCERWVTGPFVATWTPTSSGVAKVEADVGATMLDSVLGVTEDLGCRVWSTCNDDTLDLGLGSRAVFAVRAGTTYLIGVGLVGDRQNFTPTVELRVGMQQ